MQAACCPTMTLSLMVRCLTSGLFLHGRLELILHLSRCQAGLCCAADVVTAAPHMHADHDLDASLHVSTAHVNGCQCRGQLPAETVMEVYDELLEALTPLQVDWLKAHYQPEEEDDIGGNAEVDRCPV